MLILQYQKGWNWQKSEEVFQNLNNGWNSKKKNKVSKSVKRNCF